MTIERMIDNLIEAGWRVLDSEFDPAAFSNWRREAFRCVRALMGPDHRYTAYFRQFVSGPGATDVLAGEGILVAIREQLPPVTSELCRLGQPLAYHGRTFQGRLLS